MARWQTLYNVSIADIIPWKVDATDFPYVHSGFCSHRRKPGAKLRRRPIYRKADMLQQAQGQAFKKKQAVRDGTGRGNR